MFVLSLSAFAGNGAMSKPMPINTVSQNFPRTFYRLADKWNKKVGARNFESNCWTTVSCDMSDPIYKVASLMSEKLKNVTPDDIEEVSADCIRAPNGQVWVYDMRQSDSLPKTLQDSQRLYEYVRLLVTRQFTPGDLGYLMDHSHITACFFVWYFTKPDFFFKDRIIKQTTRSGIQRVWVPVLCSKKPVRHMIPGTTMQPPKVSTTSDTLLPKQRRQQAKLQSDIQALLSSAAESRNVSIEWSDPMRRHLYISGFIANSGSGLSNKQTKKLQKMYNDYVTLTSKINKALDKIDKVERDNIRSAYTLPKPIASARDETDLSSGPPTLACDEVLVDTPPNSPPLTWEQDVPDPPTVSSFSNWDQDVPPPPHSSPVSEWDPDKPPGSPPKLMRHNACELGYERTDLSAGTRLDQHGMPDKLY